MQRAEIHLSEQQRLSSQLAELQIKVKTLNSKSEGNNIAIYYLDKIQSLINSAKLQLDDPSNDVNTKVKQIEKFLFKVERLLQDSA